MFGVQYGKPDGGHCINSDVGFMPQLCAYMNRWIWDYLHD